MAADIYSVLEACSELDERLEEGNQSFDDNITKHLQQLDTRLKFTVPDFPEGWYTVSYFFCVIISTIVLHLTCDLNFLAGL